MNGPSTTSTTSPSPWPTGPTGDAAGWSTSCGAPPGPWSGPSGCCRRCPCGADRPSGTPPSRRSARRRSEPLATSSSTAPTRSARPSTGWSGSSTSGTALDISDQQAFALRPARPSTGTTTSTRCTCPRWWSTPVSRPHPAGGRRRAAKNAFEARSSLPSVTSPPSTSRTPSSPRTWWPPTPGWPPDGSPQTSGCASPCALSPRRPPCYGSTAATGATSSVTSTGATTAPPWTRSTRTPGRCSRT